MAYPDDGRFGGDRTCGQCARHYECGEEDYVACGAAFDDNPIWAQRMYSLIGMRDAIAHKESGSTEYLGQDCERMRRDDGVDCIAFRRQTHI
jgi:hypothetical protein